MEDGTLRKLELYLHDLHKKIDGIYDMLMLRHERETEQKEVLPSMKNCLTTRPLPLFQYPLFPSTLSQSGSASLQAFGAENLLHGRGCDAVCRE